MPLGHGTHERQYCYINFDLEQYCSYPIFSFFAYKNWLLLITLHLLQLGREEPAMSMDSNGKIIFAKHSEIQQANLKNIAGELYMKYLTVTEWHQVFLV